ncbi:Cell morphogenesis protein PAG1 [Vanrija albida]|uniref:Cell morphogenesis protein PAG1 n=1 Tax=Vanrija albida TaxID=181172 RepID=A0ABR3Q901_9TREE
MTEEIVIPDLDDDDDLTLPSFSRTTFGSQGASSDTELYTHRHEPSTSSDPSSRANGGGANAFNTGSLRAALPRSGLSHSASAHDLALEPPRLGKMSNGSSSSLIAHSMHQSGSGSGVLGPRKGSFASLKNVFKPNTQGAPPVPSLPPLDSKQYGAPRYPTLRDPFNRFDSPPSPTSTHTNNRPRGYTKASAAWQTPMSYNHTHGKTSVTTMHSSQRSFGGRSVTSQGSSSFRAEDYPLPMLPRIPPRSTPSRAGRQGSDTSMFGTFPRKMSVNNGDESLDNFGKTPAEEALRVVFQAFRESADPKITKLLAKPLNSHISLSAVLASGVDPAFDQVLVSLANCARAHARRVIDLLNTWCRIQSDNISSNDVRSHLSQSLGFQVRPDEAASVLGSRKASAAKYIYHRALIEIVRTVPTLGEDVALNLEHSAFSLFRSERPDDVAHRRDVSALLVDFLGELSKTRFLTVSDRFTREISGLSSGASKDQESKIEHILKGVSHLKLKVYPEDELEMAAEFLQTLSTFFANAHGSQLKSAYADTLTRLLHPVIETATAEVNHPVWAKAIAVVLQRAIAMASKPRYWPIAFPLVVVALCVSPREVFMEHWQGCIDNIASKSKDRSSRIIGMNAFIRLLWVYLHRCPESSTTTRKRLEGLIRIHFPAHSGLLVPSDLPLEPFVAILHYVFAKQFDYGQDLVTEFLHDCQPGRSVDGTAGELHHAERAYVAIRASTYTLQSVVQDIPVPFPTGPDFTRFELDNLSSGTGRLALEGWEQAEEFVEKVGPVAVSVLQSCDRIVGPVLLSSDSVTISIHASSANMDSSGEQVTHKHGDIHVAYPTRYEPTFRLLAALLDSMRSMLPVSANPTQLVNILCRCTFSADPATCQVASTTIRSVAEDPALCLLLVDNYRQFVFETRHVFREHFVATRLLESQLVRVAKLWVDILEALATHQRGSDKPAKMDPALINKIEGTGMFLLTSTCVGLRRLAHLVFTAARDLAGESRAPSAPFRYSRLVIPDKPSLSSVLQMYESNIEDVDMKVLRQLPMLTTNDHHRLDTLKGPKLLQQLAESDSPKDAALWLAIFPTFVGKVCDQLPKPVEVLRTLVGNTAVRLQTHVGDIAMGKPLRGARAINRSTSDSAVLAEQWRMYMSVLAATVDTTVTTPKQPRKDTTLSTELLTTPLIFKYLVGLLMWDDRRFQDAAVYALGSIRASSLSALAEHLLTFVRHLADSYKAILPQGARKPSTSGIMWTAAAHVFRLISPMILDNRSPSHIANLASFIGFVKITLNLLSDRAVREDYDLQSLRRWFCIVVDHLTTALGKLDSSDRFLGEEVRGAIFKLCYDWCHVGRRPDVAKARESHTLQAAADAYRGDRDRAQYLDDLQAKTKLLSAAAADAMASLCQGKLISATDATPATHASETIVEPLTVLRWIRGMFTSTQPSHHETARKALHALVKYNWDVSRLADEVLHQSFGEGEQFSLESSFFGVVADLISDGTIKLPSAQLACLSLSKLGHPVPDVRLRAFQLAIWLFDSPADRLAASKLLSAVGSTAPNVYNQAQLDMLTRFAELYPDLAIPFLAECTTRLGQLDAPRRQATLRILPAFMKVLELDPATKDQNAEDIAREHEALSNLMFLVVRFSDDHLDSIRDILVSFAGSGRSRNTTALVKFLFEQGAKRGSPDFVVHARQIIACLASSPAGDIIFDEITDFVDPSDMATSAQANVPASPASSHANLDVLFSTTLRTKPLSQGQLALLFAGELLPHRVVNSNLNSRLPTLLHVAFIHCDDPNVAMREQAQTVLLQVLRTWISDQSHVQPPEPAERAAVWATAEIKTTALSRERAELFWKTDDTGEGDTLFHAPAKMSTLVAKILGILQQLQPKLRKQWGSLALNWATSCTVRHLACRSFQVFRILSPSVNPRMLSDVLARLSSTIASPQAEIQAFNTEVMHTFASIVQSLTASEIRSYPQIFWCSMACLTTPYEAEFNEVVDLLSHVLDKTNLADPSVVSHLVSFRPPDYTEPPPHLQSLLLIGLRSSKTDMMTFDVIRRLTSVPDSELIDGVEDRLINGFVAALPWMLHSTDLGEPNEELAGMAFDLVDIAERQGNTGFSRLLTSFARARFRTKDDFIRQAAALLREYLGTHALHIVTLLLGFVLNRTDWMRDKALQVLKLILAFPEARAPLAPHANELVKPLLRLVSTKHVAQALDVLDMPLGAPDAPPADPANQVFGPIEASGWSVPNATERSAVTKQNVLAVFNTCAVESRAASAHFSVLQFSDLRPINGHPGGSNQWAASQASLELPSPPLSVPDNASMGDLVGALHSLNQFFDDGLDGAAQPAASGGTSPLQPRRQRPMAPYGRGNSGDSFSNSDTRLRNIMSRGRMPRSPSSNLPIHENRSEPDVGTYPLAQHAPGLPFVASTESFSSAPGGSLAPPAEPTAWANGLSGTYGSGHAGSRMGNLYLPTGHKTSFSSESEFGATTSEAVFGLEDETNLAVQTTEAALNGIGLGSEILDAPVNRPWNNKDRSRTPSPRDGPGGMV